MPRYMDRHEVPGATSEDVAEAHIRDLSVADEHSVHFFSYWFDADEGIAFCFAEAPGMENMKALHLDSHGMIPNEIIEVSEENVLRFLGGVRDPILPDEGTNPFRTIMFTDLEGSTRLLERVGEAEYLVLLSEHDLITRRCLVKWKGREVKHTGDGILASFDDVGDALRCALAINAAFEQRSADGGDPPLRVRIGMDAGEPVDRNNDLFGTAVNMASRVCDEALAGHVLVSETVRDSGEQHGFVFDAGAARQLKGFSEPVNLFQVSAAPPEPR